MLLFPKENHACVPTCTTNVMNQSRQEYLSKHSIWIHHNNKHILGGRGVIDLKHSHVILRWIVYNGSLVLLNTSMNSNSSCPTKA